jgi:subtilase family serine protease
MFNFKVRIHWLKGLFQSRSISPRRWQYASWRTEEMEARLLLSALTPAQVSHAYGVDNITFGGIKGDGTGQTIAIIDAYDAPNINSDLAAFDAAFRIQNTDGKGAAVLTKATPQGTPAYNATWAMEITLDVEWAHAIAPGAHILLVEAGSSSISALLGAVDYARNYAGVSVISMSWGAGEFSEETAYDSHFTTPSGHTPITFIASSGDTGGVTQWPAVSPNVVSVGGTSLNVDSSGNYLGETAWSGSGGGISLYESKPTYQSTVTQSGSKRTGPDVSWVANPGTGVQIYFNGGWTVVGGTSAGAPQWAGVVAIADQGRALNGQSTLDGKTQLLPALYSMSSTNFHDVSSGSAGSYTATVGYDLVTGRGSPYADRVVSNLLTVTGGSSSGTGGSTGGTTTTGGHKGKTRLAPKVEFAFAAAHSLVASDLQSAGNVSPSLWLDPSGDGSSRYLWHSNHLYVGHARVA